MQYRIKGMNLEDLNILVTGGAGVIGSSLVRRIPGNITILDNFSSAEPGRLEELLKEKKVQVIKGVYADGVVWAVRDNDNPSFLLGASGEHIQNGGRLHAAEACSL